MGTAEPGVLARRAAKLASFATKPERLLDVETLQIAWEIEREGTDALLPPGLHPTRPPLVTWLVQRVSESPWGPFSMAQLRVECRSGLRPRGFPVGGVVDNETARRELALRWGYALVAGSVDLVRGYDEVRTQVVVDGQPIFGAAMSDPMPLRPADAYYVANMNLAHTPNGLRLVQVDPIFEVERAERGRPVIHGFDADAWGAAGVRPSDPISASLAIGHMTLPELRYVCRPDALAYEATERVDLS